MKLLTLLSWQLVLSILGTAVVTCQKVSSGIEGTVFRLAYEYKGIEYNISRKYSVVQALRERYDAAYGQFITTETSDGKSFRIQTYSEGRYLYMDQDSQLSLGSFSDSSFFKFEPIVGSQSKFLINITSLPGGLLVTPTPFSPFKFFYSDRYPTEPPAEFILERLSLNESYSGQQSNVRQIIKLIRNGEFGNKTEAYTTILEIMEQTGSEIFDVGQYIKEDLGASSSVFQLLPSYVQLVVSGEPLKLLYADFGQTYPMKYNYSSEHAENVQPYRFTYSDGVWAIKYGSYHSLSVSATSPYQLIESKDTGNIFDFQLRLKNGEICIYSNKKGSFYPLVQSSDNRPYYFKEGNNAQASNRFTVQKIN